jgi:hypothetical protein
MLKHPLQQATQSTVLLVGLAILCGGAISLARPARSYAAPAPPNEPISADALSQRGMQLRAEIDATYKQLRASKTLANAVNEANDVTAIVLKYIPPGISFDDAEAILRASGCTIGPPQQGHIFARSHMKDRFFDLKHSFAVELIPQVPGDFQVVRRVSARIYLEYVPNADRR